MEQRYAQESRGYMSLEDRMAFREANIKELRSFFDNSVRQFDQGQWVPEDRILKAKFIRLENKPDGSPRQIPDWLFKAFVTQIP